MFSQLVFKALREESQLVRTAELLIAAQLAPRTRNNQTARLDKWLLQPVEKIPPDQVRRLIRCRGFAKRMIRTPQVVVRQHGIAPLDLLDERPPIPMVVQLLGQHLKRQYKTPLDIFPAIQPPPILERKVITPDIITEVHRPVDDIAPVRKFLLRQFRGMANPCVRATCIHLKPHVIGHVVKKERLAPLIRLLT